MQHSLAMDDLVGGTEVCFHQENGPKHGCEHAPKHPLEHDGEATSPVLQYHTLLNNKYCFQRMEI
jgi:hypothetical protein